MLVNELTEIEESSSVALKGTLPNAIKLKPNPLKWYTIMGLRTINNKEIL